MLSYSPGYSAPAVSRFGDSRMPSELVGVAGFEPAASSSRRQSGICIASADIAFLADHPPLESASIRPRRHGLSLTSSRRQGDKAEISV